MYEYVGNLHMHTTHSDGHGTVTDIARAAKRAKIDFVGITDHYHLLENGIPHHEGGYRGDVLVCVGTEFHGAHSHYLAWGVGDININAKEDAPQATIDAVNAAGGIGFMAHPFDDGTPLHDGGHAFSWHDWSVTDYTGLAVWNFQSEWKRVARNTPQAIANLALLRVANIDPQPKHLAKWDELNRDRRVVGIGETDNHAMPLHALGGLLRYAFLPYAVAFRTVNTHVLLEQPLTGTADEDSRAIYRALRQGRCFVANRQRGRGTGFRCVVRGPGVTAHMGDTVKWKPGLRLHATVPSRASLSVIADGDRVFRLPGRSITWPIPGPGLYRIEARRSGVAGRHRLWILGNHIRVVDA